MFGLSLKNWLSILEFLTFFSQLFLLTSELWPFISKLWLFLSKNVTFNLKILTVVLKTFSFRLWTMTFYDSQSLTFYFKAFEFCKFWLFYVLKNPFDIVFPKEEHVWVKKRNMFCVLWVKSLIHGWLFFPRVSQTQTSSSLSPDRLKPSEKLQIK